MPREPQSYGSDKDWVKGNVGEEVNRLKGHPNSQHGDFYESRHDGEESAPDQGGKVSPVQLEESDASAGELGGGTPDGGATERNVRTEYSGAKRDGYFKDRDYK